jgi:RNA polymerase sigma-70 factor (ECF subfamily)
MQAVCDAHARPIYRFLLRLTLGDREAAEDLLQETLLRAWRNEADLPGEVETLRPWLFTVARNLAIDAGRYKQTRPTEVGGDDITRIPVATDAFDRLLTAATVRQALLELSPEHRTVLVELYYRGASAAETAARTGIPEGTVKSRAHYALRALRNVLASAED